MTARSRLRPRRRAGLLAGMAVLLGLLAGGVVVARAQLGATPEEMEKRFGPVVRHSARIWHDVLYDTTVVDGDIYRKGDIFVRAAFLKGKVVLLEVMAAGRLLQQKDVDEYLALSAGGARWEMGRDSTDKSKFYHRTDSGAVAQWQVGEFGSLLVSTENGPPTQIGDKLLQ